MVVKLCRRALFAALVLPTAQAQAQSQRFHVQSREPATSWYVYAAEDWFQSSDTSREINITTLEGRAIMPSGLEIAIRSEGFQLEDGDGMERGNTTLSMVQSIYDLPAISFLSFEYGEVVSHAEHTLDSFNRYARIRLQAGPTLAAFALSVTAVDLTEPALGEGGELFTTSIGLRTQWRQLYVGSDANITVQDGVGPITTVDLVGMYRFQNGHSIYGTVEQGVSSGDDLKYASIAYEVRF